MKALCGGAGTQQPGGCYGNALRGAVMAMDVWYELRLREMSNVNEAANELVRDAEDSACDAPDQQDEE